MKIVKGNFEINIKTLFGSSWPGQRYLTKIRWGTKGQRTAFKKNGRSAIYWGYLRETHS